MIACSLHHKGKTVHTRSIFCDGVLCITEYIIYYPVQYIPNCTRLLYVIYYPTISCHWKRPWVYNMMGSEQIIKTYLHFYNKWLKSIKNYSKIENYFQSLQYTISRMKDLVLYGLSTCVIFSKHVIPVKQLTNHYLTEERKRKRCAYMCILLPEAFGMKIYSKYCTWDSNYIC